MADFEDITGWREELAAFEKTEEGRAFFAGNKRYGGRKVPYENVVQMVELIRGDEELHEALKKTLWFAQYVEEHDLEAYDEQYQELHPIDAYDTLIFFGRWYLTKSRIHADKSNLLIAANLADDVEAGNVTDLRTEEAMDFTKKKYSPFVSFPGEET
jgi:hypothetical protein